MKTPKTSTSKFETIAVEVSKNLSKLPNTLELSKRHFILSMSKDEKGLEQFNQELLKKINAK